MYGYLIYTFPTAVKFAGDCNYNCSNKAAYMVASKSLDPVLGGFFHQALNEVGRAGKACNGGPESSYFWMEFLGAKKYAQQR